MRNLVNPVEIWLGQPFKRVYREFENLFTLGGVRAANPSCVVRKVPAIARRRRAVVFGTRMKRGESLFPGKETRGGSVLTRYILRADEFNAT